MEGHAQTYARGGAFRGAAARIGPRFDVAVVKDGERTTVTLSGEMDLATAPQLEGAITQACHEGARQLVVDLSGLEFIDASGLHAIVVAREQCTRNDCDFCLVPGRKHLQRLFKISGLVDRLPFRDPATSG